MKQRGKFLYHSTYVGNWKHLKPQPLRKQDGFKKGERGVWATNRLKSSKAFGICQGTFSIEDDKVILHGWKLDRIPDDFVAYTYYFNPRNFKQIDDWQFLAEKKAKPIKIVPYNLKSFLKKNYKIVEESN